MLAAERRTHIIERLRKDGKVLVSELSEAYHLSEDTIRRDLRELAEQGLVQRVHGGALPASPAATAFAHREGQAQPIKQAIARTAASLLQDGQVIVFDGGTTTLLVARALPAGLRATAITHSPPIAIALAEHPLMEVVLIGGRLHKPSRVAVGAATVASLRDIRADVCLLGICSLHPEVGISAPDWEEAHVKRAMIAISAEVIALAGAEKLGTAAPYVVAPIGELTHLVTEAGVPEAMVAPYKAHGITVVRAAEVDLDA